MATIQTKAKRQARLSRIRSPRMRDLHFGVFPDVSTCGKLRSEVLCFTTDMRKWEAATVERCAGCVPEVEKREAAEAACA